MRRSCAALSQRRLRVAQRGMTLVELVFVMLVVAVLAAVSVSYTHLTLPTN